MANYRQIAPYFWTDTKINEEFSFEEKFLFLYLLTNNHTNICGCYEISIKQIADETALTREQAEELIRALEKHKVIRYDRETREVFIVNWGKHNWSRSESLLEGVKGVSKYIKSPVFKEEMKKLIQEKEKDTLSHPSPDGIYTSISDSVFISEAGSDSATGSEFKAESVSINLSGNSDFSKFWEEYPRKVGKGDAEKAFEKTGVPLGSILAGLEKMKKTEQWTRENGRYIPHPATWLNRRGWEDEEVKLDERAAAAAKSEWNIRYDVC